MGEILERIVADVRIDRGAGEVGARPSDQQGISIRFRARDLRRADRAAVARPVLHEELLLERGRKLARHQAPELVGAAAGRESHHDLHRPAWPFLRTQIPNAP
jgi:hypothetical protein